ncbi:hypothetical protein M404DRAFT_1001581 [Pisolithus tinctorius Marx 270]|uniref:Uncharacterized protein n=1 Tax=Pisolithus tinctorius Marx 270 TaxID=870435 RepID=A0A0C3NSK4_PISTI|nr:hypothetical protein M404DRAFT_1005333 [Pisolithus tinctorius Marx 270]KIO02965.1 hypothetical protein M404DRAFT_1001581 [Pisolithus tinctorius Marx 270]
MRFRNVHANPGPTVVLIQYVSSGVEGLGHTRITQSHPANVFARTFSGAQSNAMFSVVSVRCGGWLSSGVTASRRTWRSVTSPLTPTSKTLWK